jgi:hypothetical protein
MEYRIMMLGIIMYLSFRINEIRRDTRSCVRRCFPRNWVIKQLSRRLTIGNSSTIGRHAALDRLEEITGTNNSTNGRPSGSMVGRNMTVTASSPHWTGLLLPTRAVSDEELSVYGYVTATNIKFLAFMSIANNDNSSNNDNSKTAVKLADVQKFLTLAE